MSTLQDTVSQYVPFLKNKPSLSRDEALRTRPIRNTFLKWEMAENGEARLFIPRRKDRLGKILCRIFHAGEFRELIMDEVGSYIWNLCDGEHTVQTIVAAACNEYKMTRRECETSIGAYLKTLGDRNLIGFQTGGRQKK